MTEIIESKTESKDPISKSSKKILAETNKILNERKKRLGSSFSFHPHTADSSQIIRLRDKAVENFRKNSKRLPTPFESTVILLSVTSLSIGVGAGLGIGTYHYMNKSRDFRTQVDHTVQNAYQKQIDRGEKPDFKKAYTQSNLDTVRKNFVDDVSRTWTLGGLISGSVVGGLVTTALASGALGITALTGGALLLAGALAPVVATGVFAGAYYLVGRNRAKARAKDIITESLSNEQNMRGVDPEIKKANEKHIIEEAENILNRIQRMKAENEKGYSGRRSRAERHFRNQHNTGKSRVKDIIEQGTNPPQAASVGRSV